MSRSFARANFPFKPEVENVIKLTLAFAKAVGAEQADKSENILLSAYNATTALSMVAKGAKGQTKEEFAQTLFGADAKSLDAQVDTLAALNQRVLAANKGAVELKTANAVWANKDLIRLKEEYKAELKKIFDADIDAVPFNGETVKKINKWASDNTGGMIPAVISKLQPNDAAVLSSSLFFRGDHTSEFDPKLTQDKPFNADGGKTLTLPTMRQYFKKAGAIRYLDGADFEAVALTFGAENFEKDKKPTMRLVLVRPKNDNVAARDWFDGQDGQKVPAWLDSYAFEKVTGTVELPKLKMKQNHDLIPVLKSMGIKAAFGDAADFSPMTVGKDPLTITKVSHDVAFEADEKGAKGAAVTTITMMKRSAAISHRPKNIDIKLDRSFVFAVQDIETGAPIFTGVINKPADGEKPAAKARAKTKQGGKKKRDVR